MSETARTYEYDGQPWIYVRTEKRTGCPGAEHLFVTTKDRIVVSRWFPKWPPDFVPINDTGGRAEATHWAILAEGEHEKANALAEAMRAAIKMVDDRVAEQLRDVYVKAMEKASVKC